MIPLAVPNLAGREAEYLAECVSSTFVSSVGPFVDRFEQQVAAAAGAARGVATASGTTALQAALIAVGVEPGDLVIIPALTFIATANAVSHCHAQPWLLDVDEDSWTLCPVELERALSEETFVGEQGRVIHRATGKRVAAIVPVYTLGMPADMDHIVATAARFGVPVVADAAAALGATYKGQPLGELGAVLTMFSFNGNKTVTAGGGGAIVGNDEAAIARFRHLTTTARVGADYDHDMVGYNFRMTNLQAAVGCAQMEQLSGFVVRKRHIDAVYRDLAARFDFLSQFPKVDWADSACWFSGFVLKNETSVELRQALRAKGVDARPFWKPMHLQKPYAACPQGRLDVSDRIWPSIVTLPCSTGISDEELATVVRAVTDVLGARAT